MSRASDNPVIWMIRATAPDGTTMRNRDPGLRQPIVNTDERPETCRVHERDIREIENGVPILGQCLVERVGVAMSISPAAPTTSHP